MTGPGVFDPTRIDEARLEASEERYRTLVDHLRDTAVTVCDRDLRIVMAAGQAIADAGLDPADLIGRRLDEVVAPADLEQLAESLQSGFAGTPFAVEYKSSRTGREYMVDVIPIDRGGDEVEAIQIVFRDITARMLSELRALAADRRFAVAVHISPIGVALTSLEGRYLGANEAMCQMLGRPLDELLSTSAVAISHPDDKAGAREAFAAVARGDIRQFQVDKRYLRPDGEAVWVSVNAAVVDDELGHPSQLLAFNMDVTEHRRSAVLEERRRLARDLHDGLAHELTFVMSAARRLGASLDGSPLVDQILGAAERALDEARRAITALSSDRPEPFADSLERTAEDLAARHGMALRLRVDPEADVSPEATENVLRFVREAMTNAARHGGAATIDGSAWPEGEALHVMVSDDGGGFDPDTVDQGFGLTSMRERAEAFGGVFRLESAPARGATVEVVVPRGPGGGPALA